MTRRKVILVIASAISAGGYDGLYAADGECACELGDLAPCGQLRDDCMMGYRYWCEDSDCEYTETNHKHWHMRETK